jgi:Pyridoxamine 5'-phosphate oxidase
VASASADGAPYLVPLSFDWDGEALLVATPTDSPTGRNLAATGAVRLGLGHTRDVSMIEGDVEVLEIDALPRERGDRFAARTGFDPRADHALPLVPRHPAPHPGVARGERDLRPRVDARRPLAVVTLP